MRAGKSESKGVVMRKLAAAVVSSAALLSAVASASPAVVNLDRPGAFEALARENPEHFRRVADVLRIADELPCHTEKFGLTVAKFDARDARCGLLLMTSYPAKRHLSFVLDRTRYVTVVTMRDLGMTLVPAQK
jgi:hypothetical protein